MKHSNFTNSTNRTLELTLLPSIDFGIAKIVCSLPGLFINAIFITTVARSHRLRKNLILLSLLAFGDLLCSLHVLSLGLSDILTDEKLYHLTNFQCFYERPHLVLLIFCTHIESVATLLVAIERAIAILLPYFYNKCNRDRFNLMACLICTCIAVASFVASVIASVVKGPFLVYKDMCYPSTAVNPQYGGFVFMITIILGSISLIVYLILFITILCNSAVAKRACDTSFATAQQKRQKWLLKISCILAFSTFVFIVIPYTILYIGRNDRSQTSVVGELRRYVSFTMSANSFMGMALCMIASPELRTAVKGTLFCEKMERPEFGTASNRTRTSRLSTSLYSDNVVRSMEEQV